MHEILRALPPGSFVLDLGCAAGSFPSSSTAATVVRLDLEPRPSPNSVRGDASQLPFADRTFAAVICNHSLEHFDDLHAALREIGRIIHPIGALFISVPDASTVTDKLYRWLARGGGHVNAFTAPDQVVAAVESACRTSQRESSTPRCPSSTAATRRVRFRSGFYCSAEATSSPLPYTSGFRAGSTASSAREPASTAGPSTSVPSLPPSIWKPGRTSASAAEARSAPAIAALRRYEPTDARSAMRSTRSSADDI